MNQNGDITISGGSGDLSVTARGGAIVMAEGKKGQSAGGEILYDAKTDFGSNGLQHIQSGSGSITLSAAVGAIIDDFLGEDPNITTNDLIAVD